jgi:hypothetical protein
VLTTSSIAKFPPIIDLSQASADVTISGAVAYDKTGYRFTSGDYNGDGLVDIAVVSEGHVDPGSFPFFHIFWGGLQLPQEIDLASYAGDITYVRAMADEDGTDSWLTSCDFNGDGIQDIAWGIPCFNIINCTGKVYLIFGTHDFPDILDLTAPAVTVVSIQGIPGGAGFGGALGIMLASGDVNGDGMDELVMAAREFSPGGQVYVLWGTQGPMPPTFELGNASANVLRLIDPRYYYSSGTGLDCGDANGDGFDDILIGSAEGGEAMLVLGASSMPDTMLLNEPPVKRFHKTTNDRMGWRVGLADFNGDGYDDMVISTPFASPLGCEYCGDVMIAYGDDVLPDSVIMDSAPSVTRMFGAGVSQSYGISLTHGDVNKDGYDDIVMASDPDEFDVNDVGKVTIVYGAASPPDTVMLGTDPTLTRIYAESRPDDFGTGLLSSDVNMDGTDDVLVGAHWASALGRTGAGKAYIFYGEAEPTDVKSSPPVASRLRQNYPNPFNPVTFIPLALPRAEVVSLGIYDVQGRRVKSLLARKRLDAGERRLIWDGTDDRGEPAPSGVYFYRLVGLTFSEARKMVLLR